MGRALIASATDFHPRFDQLYLDAVVIDRGPCGLHAPKGVHSVNAIGHFGDRRMWSC